MGDFKHKINLVRHKLKGTSATTIKTCTRVGYGLGRVTLSPGFKSVGVRSDHVNLFFHFSTGRFRIESCLIEFSLSNIMICIWWTGFCPGGRNLTCGRVVAGEVAEGGCIRACAMVRLPTTMTHLFYCSIIVRLLTTLKWQKSQK